MVCERPNHYSPVYNPIDFPTNILFSSGTTGNKIAHQVFSVCHTLAFCCLISFLLGHWSESGEPKAIPWTQLSPIRAANDGWAYVDLQVGDVFCYPTNLGWVAGPIVLYEAFLSGATFALYHGSPLGGGFGKFVQVMCLIIILLCNKCHVSSDSVITLSFKHL